ncbi:MAG: hypothetical protein OXL40_02450 [Bacteroidota bacterium]|nr:hypothetical protein [Bacteroidota bacterium]
MIHLVLLTEFSLLEHEAPRESAQQISTSLSPTSNCHHRTTLAACSIINNRVTIVKGVATESPYDIIHLEILELLHDCHWFRTALNAWAWDLIGERISVCELRTFCRFSGPWRIITVGASLLT